MKSIKRTMVLALSICVLATVIVEAKLVASKESEWPQWRGPHRDGVSDETGLLASWPEGGPRLVWKTGKLDKGYSSPIITHEAIYITGDEGELLNIFALDLKGKQKWKVQNGQSWKRNFPGSRASCTYSDGRLYHMNAHGRLLCLDPKDGQEIWNTSILGQYASRNITWGISESPLVVEGRLYVTPAGQKALMVALDAGTGDLIWKTPALDGETPAYASAVMIHTGDRRQIVTGGSAHTFGIDASSGKLLWTYRHEIDKPVMVTPSYYRGDVVVSQAYRNGSKTYGLTLDTQNNRVQKKWLHEIGNPFGSAVCADGNIVCSSSHQPKGWYLIDADTGQIKDQEEKLAHGSSIYADGKFYGLCQDGKMVLLEAGSKGLRIVSEFQFIKGKRDVWAHPVICNGRLYLRYADTLYCYNIKNP